MELQFGKFKGLSISDPQVTTKYLEWLSGEMAQTLDATQAELSRREQLEAGNVTLVERMVVAGFRALAKECRGETEEMNELTGARAILEEILEKYFAEQADKAKVAAETQQMNQARDSKDSRNRATAMQLLKDKHADPDDVAWARKILGAT
jgi:hypothetical protein